MAAGMTKRDQYTLSAKTCNGGILQIDVPGASVFGWFQTFSLSRGGISESCLQSTDPRRKVVPKALHILFVLPSRKLSMRVCLLAPFTYHLPYLHSGAIPLSARQS